MTDWQVFAMDCLDAEQLRHCEHLDGGRRSRWCQYCREERRERLANEANDA